MTINDSFHIYDTTLRDGAQQEGLNLSVHDKLTIARHLDDLGVGFIEGGWPGANPKDTEFFALAKKELKLKNATFVAFGATRRPHVKAADDSLCWRTILWPTTSNTTDECLGFASIGKKDSLGGPYTVTNIMPFVLKSTD